MIRQAAGLRRRLGVSQQTPVVLFVGRLTSDKGIPELMEAFLRLDKQLPDVRLVLAGCFEDEDPLPAHTRRCIETHPHVIFAGAVHDIAPYYAMADVVVLPSHREGLPTVVLEAQAAAKPVIGASATGIVDLIKDGETGLLFPVGDAPALAKALERLITDESLAARLGLAGQELVRREFRQEQIWEALYQGYLAALQTKELPPFFMPLPTHERQFGGPAQMNRQ
jgi:glycosyltransferase involved in cell wall biosynthesis